MPQSLAHVALVVRDYDEAIAFYVDTLGFELPVAGLKVDDVKERLGVE